MLGVGTAFRIYVRMIYPVKKGQDQLVKEPRNARVARLKLFLFQADSLASLLEKYSASHAWATALFTPFVTSRYIRLLVGILSSELMFPWQSSSRQNLGGCAWGCSRGRRSGHLCLRSCPQSYRAVRDVSTHVIYSERLVVLESSMFGSVTVW